MKNIIIVIALVVLVGGGIWFLLRSMPEELIMPEEKIAEEVEDETVEPVPSEFKEWQTYRNEEYGYEIKYPSSFSEGGEYGKSNRYDHQVWRRNPLEEEWESLTIYVNADIAKYRSFDELWETIEKKAEDDVAKISGEKCIESFARIPNPEGVKIFYNLSAGCMAPPNTINSEAIILRNGLTFRIFHACETTLDCRNRFNQILSTFRFLE